MPPIELAGGNKPNFILLPPSQMTPNDLQLIARANTISRWRFYEVRKLIPLADTPEARERLYEIYFDLIELRDESL